MAYITGSATSYDDLRTALLAACVDAGWSLADGILSWGAAAHVRPYVSASTTLAEGPGLILECGTGKSGSALTDTCTARPRLGRPAANANYVVPAFPVVYHLFTFGSEVMLLMEHDVKKYYYLAFGVSDIPGVAGSGLWAATTAAQRYPASLGGARIGAELGLGGVANSYGSSAGPWWSTVATAISDSANIISVAGSWLVANSLSSATEGRCNAIEGLAPLLGLLPSAWSQEAILLPIRVLQTLAGNKNRVIAEVRNARYTRLDSYEPGQVITLGTERWMVFPFYAKNSAVRDGVAAAGGADHTGTFGWAIRYEGP